jgi:ribose transport system permease protein
MSDIQDEAAETQHVIGQAEVAAIDATVEGDAVPEVAAEGAGVAVDTRPVWWRRLIVSPVLMTFLFLIVTMVIFSVLAPGTFNTVSNIQLLALNVAILTVVSVGTTFVIATAGIDLSIPSGIVLGEVFAVKALSLIQVGSGTAVEVPADQTKLWYIVVALAASLLAGLILGLINGFTVGYLRIPPMLATLGTLGAGLGIALLMQNGVNVATYALNPAATGQLIPGLNNLILIGLIVVGIGYVGMHLAVFGRHTLAIGSSEEAARRVGINVERHLLKVYVVGALASGLGGFLAVAYFSTTSVAGHSTDNLSAITAVALRGYRQYHRHPHRCMDPRGLAERLHHRRRPALLADGRRRRRPHPRHLRRPAPPPGAQQALTPTHYESATRLKECMCTGASSSPWRRPPPSPSASPHAAGPTMTATRRPAALAQRARAAARKARASR